MSYTILYAKQFIKIDENNVIPFILQGDNNVYESDRKRARDWGNSYAFTRTMITSNEALMQEVEKLKLETIKDCDVYVKQYDETWAFDEKRFGYHTGIAIGSNSTTKTTFGMFKNFYANGIKNAKTIEELMELNCSIGMKVYRWKDSDITDKGIEIKPDVMFSSTEQAVAAIKEYEEYYKGHNVHLYLFAYGMDRAIEKLKKPKQPKQKTKVDHYFRIDTPFGYFLKNTKNGFRYGTWSAKPFRTEKDALKVIAKLQMKFPDYNFKPELVQKEAYV